MDKFLLQELNNLPEAERLELSALLNPWRLIETAPKDGKPILCCFKGQFAWMFFVCAANGSDTRRAGYAEPTHWLILNPPSEDKT